MYGDSTPIVVYGWHETDSNRMIHSEWFEKHYSELEIYTTEVVRMYAVNILYGVVCTIHTDGTITIPATKDLVDKAYREISTNAEEKYSPLGIHLGITGGHEWCQDFYIPGIGQVPNNYKVHSDSDEFEISDEMDITSSSRSSSYLSSDD